MRTVLIPCDDATSIQQATTILSHGGLVAFPTDTVYGIAASVNNPYGIDRLYQAKSRAINKAIAVLIADMEQLPLLASVWPPCAENLAKRFWPGALTLIVPKHPHLPANLSTYPTLGVRMPNHTFARMLMRATGPLATSSANISGEGDTYTAQQVYEQLVGRVELILDGGPVLGGVPSTVVDCTQDPPRILRQGAISAEEIALP